MRRADDQSFTHRHRSPSYYVSQLRRAHERYTAGKIDGDRLARCVDEFLARDATR